MALSGPMQRPILIGNAASARNPPRKKTSSDSDWGDGDDELFASLADNFELTSQTENIPVAPLPNNAPASSVRPVQPLQRGPSRSNLPMPSNAPSVNASVPRPMLPAPRGTQRPAAPIPRPNQPHYPAPSQKSFRAPMGTQLNNLRSSYPFAPSQMVPAQRAVGGIFQLIPNLCDPRLRKSLLGTQLPAVSPVASFVSISSAVSSGAQPLEGESVADLQKQIDQLKAELRTKTGETKILREKLSEKETEISNHGKEKQEIILSAKQRETDLESELALVKKRCEADINFKDQDLFKMTDQLHRLEMQKNVHEASASDVIGAGRKRPTDQLEQHENGGFQTNWPFHGGSARKKSCKRSYAEMAESPVQTVSAEVQTDFSQLSVAGKSAVSDPVPVPQCDDLYSMRSERMARLSEFLADLNDCRLEVDERLSTSVLINPFPKFTLTSSIKFNNRKEYVPVAEENLTISRNELKDGIKTIWKQGSQNTWPTHLVAADALHLFMESNAALHIESPEICYEFLLSALVSAAGEHVRQYVGLLYNLCWFHNQLIRGCSVYVLEEISIVCGKMTLLEYALKVLRSLSSVTVQYLKAMEHNCKVALVILRKLLENFPELHKLYVQHTPCGEGAHGGKIPKMADSPDKTSECADNEPITSFLSLKSHGRDRRKSLHGDWIAYHITSGYGIGQAAQEQMIIRFMKFPEILRSTSILDLMLMLMDPLQFKIFEYDIMRLSCLVVTVLADIVDVYSKEGRIVAERLPENEVVLNYVAMAETEEYLLAPVLELLLASVKFKPFVITWCSKDIDTCILLRLYYNVFLTTDKQELLTGCDLHIQLIDLLLEILMSDDAEICSLVCQKKRHCTEPLAWQLTELLHAYVCLIQSSRMYIPDLEVPANVQQFVTKSVMWLFALKRKQKHRIWNKYFSYVEQFVQAIVVVLHDEHLYEYDEDFGEMLTRFYLEYPKHEPKKTSRNNKRLRLCPVMDTD
ncbi:uncharacterized protein LOC129580786 [Paramacrobiotus metropolitanus]|uniref:uncharacterized protein LOC129580786 n=1 Tax=Paramacrobiotus metropolitanus TaxID=2943436 RepID=UPI0024460C69|nr:uncharacterized protein LOC129580786 [Paramacrobiotus metropolitanus]